MSGDRHKRKNFRLGGVGGSASGEIGLPLPRQQRLLLVVAVLARRHDVDSDGAPAADERYDVIESQRPRADRAAAVLAHAGGDAPPPPGALAERAGPSPLPADVVGVGLGNEATLSAHWSSLTDESCTDSSSHSFISHATRSSASLRDWAIWRARCPSR